VGAEPHGTALEQDQVRERLRDHIVDEAERIRRLAAECEATLRTAAYAQGVGRISATVDAAGSAEAYRRTS